MAFGVKDQGFSYFLLLFYSQVVGVDARLVGLALTIALVFDAVSDPVVGYWSDNFRSRWGRRHPFLYASAIPTAVAFGLIWMPPSGWSEWGLFAYLLVLSVLTRTAITFFETPSAALAPELTRDYVARSTLLSYRSAFQWIGGNGMTVLMFIVLFPAFVTTTIPNGQFNPEAYRLYGFIGGGVILASILVSSLGTHARIPDLHIPSDRSRQSVSEAFGEIFAVFSNRSFLAIAAAAIVLAVTAGLSSALSVYISTYFWGFSSEQIGVLTLGIFVGAFAGALIAKPVSGALGKRRGAIVLGFIAMFGTPVILALRAFDVLAGDGDPTTFWIVFTVAQFEVCLTVCMAILIASMIADISEDVEVSTGRRSEGVLFAANTFIGKAMTGIGLTIAAQVITLARFPTGAAPDAVPPEALQRLGLIYIPIIIGLRLLLLVVLARYRIDRSGHEENLRRLAASG